jgi:hypothetical protein
MADRNGLRLITGELTYHLHTLIKEADEGDAEARQWLVDWFPSHEWILRRHWQGEIVTGMAIPEKRYSGASAQR